MHFVDLSEVVLDFLVGFESVANSEKISVELFVKILSIQYDLVVACYVIHKCLSCLWELFFEESSSRKWSFNPFLQDQALIEP